MAFVTFRFCLRRLFTTVLLSSMRVCLPSCSRCVIPCILCKGIDSGSTRNIILDGKFIQWQFSPPPKTQRHLMPTGSIEVNCIQKFDQPQTYNDPNSRSYRVIDDDSLWRGNETGRTAARVFISHAKGRWLGVDGRKGQLRDWPTMGRRTPQEPVLPGMTNGRGIGSGWGRFRVSWGMRDVLHSRRVSSKIGRMGR